MPWELHEPVPEPMMPPSTQPVLRRQQTYQRASAKDEDNRAFAACKTGEVDEACFPSAPSLHVRLLSVDLHCPFEQPYDHPG